ncbi:MAG: gamma-butyrobetaine hydroxylase-like domain-containing protein [Sedimenticola sp.]|nr:gamma-butyrobetaine hydroxylase-like domain-containing protein [Sedimenticola sp.]MCW8902765.1 gamma-butyrobetaine hydroxylase-like domain-containing protein [Sedimenticola sp.]
MNEKQPTRTPTAINLHSKSRLLAIEFSDGASFRLPCEYLRVFAKAKEVRTLGNPVTGKESVNITRIEPQGQYAVRFIFDDGHDSSIYSWDTLYELGVNQEQNWQAYQESLRKAGYKPGASASTEGPRHIQLLYFTYLVKQLQKEAEQVEIPPSVTDVSSLIEWLRRRNPDQAHLFREGSFQVTVNKQFSEPFTRIDTGDEVALIPTSPNAPTKK